MLLVFFTWLRSATASHSVALCQQNVNRSAVVKKNGIWKCGGEPSRAKSQQCSHAILIERERSKKNHSKGRKDNGKVKQEIQREMGGWEAGLLPLFSPLAATHAFERIFSSGKISADDTVVKMKTPQRLVDVTVIDS